MAANVKKAVRKAHKHVAGAAGVLSLALVRGVIGGRDIAAAIEAVDTARTALAELQDEVTAVTESSVDAWANEGDHDGSE